MKLLPIIFLSVLVIQLVSGLSPSKEVTCCLILQNNQSFNGDCTTEQCTAVLERWNRGYWEWMVKTTIVPLFPLIGLSSILLICWHVLKKQAK